MLFNKENTKLQQEKSAKLNHIKINDVVKKVNNKSDK